MKKQILTVIISMFTTLGLVGFTTNFILPKVQPVVEVLETKPVELIEIKIEPIEIEINQHDMFLDTHRNERILKQIRCCKWMGLYGKIPIW